MDIEKYKILVRADSGNRIGMGHITESLSLLKSIKDNINADILFLTRDYPAGVEKIKQAGFSVKTVETTGSIDKDAENVLNQAKEFAADLIMVDLLRVKRVDQGAVVINDDYFLKLKSSGLPLVAVFDDTVMLETSADLVVNFHICQDENYYNSLSSKDKYLIGPKYALLDENYSELGKIKKDIPDICGTVFVNQGGSDPYALTAKIIRSLMKINMNNRIDIVVGAALTKEHLDEIEALGRQCPDNYKFYYNVKPHQMRELMNNADFAVTAAGNTLYELCALGVASLIISHHKDHDDVAEEFARRKAAVNLGIGTQLSEADIAEAVKKIADDAALRKRLSSKARRLADGCGALRVCESIVSLLREKRKNLV